MSRGLKQRLVVLIACLVLAVVVAGCAEEATAPPTPDPAAPETELTFAPLEGDTSTFRIHFYWNGSDRDGEVVRFRYALDADTLKPQSEWTTTTAKDTTLLFLVDPVKEVLGHVFWISSEDNEGRIDPTPAKRFFSAKTIPPFSRIVKGPDAPGTIIGPNFTFEWEGTDPDGGETGGPAPVDSFEYLLLQLGGTAEGDTKALPRDFTQEIVDMINAATGPSLTGDYTGWKWVGIRAPRKRFLNVTPGPYVFAERAVDIAGASEKNLRNFINIRHFNVTNRNPGPQLIISSSVLTQPLPAASGAEDIVRKEIQIFQGETISFSWIASAETYGGEIVGFTYALDDTTTAEWGSVNIVKTAVTFTPQVLGEGLHFLFVRVVDDGGLVTNAKVPLKIIRPAFKDASSPPQVLLVDDAVAPAGQQIQRQLGSLPNYPPDATEDAWWRSTITVPLGQEFGVAFGSPDGAGCSEGVGWDTLCPQNETGGQERTVPKPEQLAPFRTVIWSTDLTNTEGSSPTGFWRTLVGGAYSELAGYLRAGGTLIVTGFQLGYQTSRPATTVTANYSIGLCAGLDEGTSAFNLSYFPRLFMGIDGALASDAGVRTLGARDFIEARVTAAGAALGFQTAQVDVGSAASGAKWDPFAFSGVSANESYAPGLPKIEGWKMQTEFGCPGPTQNLIRRENLSLPISIPIYTYHGVNQAPGADRPYEFTGPPSPREGLVVGLAVQSHDFGNSGRSGSDTIEHGDADGAVGRCVFLGFPIYYMEDAQAYAIMRAAFAYVNASPTLPILP